MKDTQTHHSGHASERVPEYTDPVCGMPVSAETEYSYTYNNTIHLFCSRHCLEKFKATPNQYLGAVPVLDKQVDDGVGPDCLTKLPG